MRPYYLLLIPLPNGSDVNDFILQAAPGIFLKIDKFGIGLTSENLFDYNFTINGRDSTPDERIYAGMLSYDFEIGGLWFMLSHYLKMTPK